MSLLDALRPKWQNSNPEKRLEAVEEMDVREQSTLERIALSDEDSSVRTAAVKKLTLIPSLSAISKKDNEAGVRRLAESRYFEEVAKKLKDYREPANEDILAFVDEMKDTRYADDLVKSMPSSELRLELVKKTGKVNVLAYAANKDAKEEIAKTAVDRIESETTLTDISKNSKHTSVRKIALEKIRAKKEADDGGKKAAALLNGKRNALIQQAHSLAGKKNPHEVKDQFEALMNEAKALGMGEKQSTLDEIYASYLKFLAEADAERVAAEKANAEKEASKQQLMATLEELESILASDDAKSKTDRIAEIVNEWNEKKSIMDSDAVKRFNLALLKSQELKNAAEAVAEEEVDMEDEGKARKQLLDMLQAIADSDVNETTQKHVHSIVREWEKLPLLEGSDVNLQSYNTLRNKLKEKITAFEETAQKRFEENSEKLRKLIDRVKSLDENEDFKSLSQKLRDTFAEWKAIVGEQKFKYHDLWLEYKSATERFQEMRQWESWHNEKDRAAILEEMEMLAKEPGSQDVLNKLREYSNKWKNIGPVSPAKFVEFRDKFQALFTQIRDNCSQFIEEREVERQKNLESKQELCKKIEDLVADATIFWKDKYKAMQEIQESWKNIGMVPKESLNALIERFKAASNAFFAQYKESIKQEDQNREANLAKKMKLIEEAEALKESTDWNATSNKLKQLQDAWKSTGPVPKSKSEEIWTRFRSACDAFFDKKRSHFEEMDNEKQGNLVKKVAICDKLDAMDASNITPETAEAVKAIREEWKAIGMVPKESVEAINERFNSKMNLFITAMAATDEALQKQLEKIKAKKLELIGKVKQFAESAGSNQLADAVRDIQKEWRELGSCGVEDSEIHKEFRSACDDFFTRRRDQLDIQEQARENNLQKKQLLCEQAEDLLTDLSEATVAGAMNKVKHLRRLWKEVGAVPREQSDKIWKRFNGACDKVFAFGRKDEPKQDAPAPAPEA
jgi:hypothetical protein